MNNPKVIKTVYFVRHGQSEDNAGSNFHSADSPLSKEGEKQADSIAKRISKLSFETLISSPYERAKQTAEAIVKVTGKHLECSELFVERRSAQYMSGKPFTDKKAAALFKECEKSICTPNMRVADEENFDDFVVRADKALDFLQNRTEQSLVVVTHGFFLRMIVARVLLGDFLSGEIFGNIRISDAENSGIAVLQYQEKTEGKFEWHLYIYNDHAHLGD